MSILGRLYLLSVMLSLTLAVYGQDSKPSPHPAPVPSAIRTAQRVFISNAGQDTADFFSGGPERAYKDFYSQVQTLRVYEIVSSPRDADIVFEIALQATPGFSTTFRKSGIRSDAAFRLRVLDPKTQTVLWTLYEHLDLANFRSNRDKDFDAGLRRLVADLRNLPATQDPAQQ